MVGASKILTVSYGTFSCTLEGFEDSFDTMKAIAEYFRDLAADDRYFGAEPPTPDAEMLQRIAEREIRKRVEARVGEDGIVLRPAALPGDDGPPVFADEAPEARSIHADPMPASRTRPEDEPESVAAKLARIRAVVEKARSAAPAMYGEPGSGNDLDAIRPAPRTEGPPDPKLPDPAAEAPERRHARPAAEPRAETGDAAAEAEAGSPKGAGPSFLAERGVAATGIGIPAETVVADVQAPGAIPYGTGSSDAAGAAARVLTVLGTAGRPASGLGPEATAAPRARARVLKLKREDLAVHWPAAAPHPVARPPAAAAQDEARLPAALEAELQAELAALRAEFDSPDAGLAKVETSPPRQGPLLLQSPVQSPSPPPSHPAAKADAAPEMTESGEEAGDNLSAGSMADAGTASTKEGLPEAGREQVEIALQRLWDETNTKLEGVEQKRRRASIAHLKAAVAATFADRKAGAGPEGRADEERDRRPYRQVLAKVVRGNREATATDHPDGSGRLAPLMLVSEQRIDQPQPDPRTAHEAIRPRRVSAGGDDKAIPDAALARSSSFETFVAERGTTGITGVLEAAAAFLHQHEGQDHFSRPQVLRVAMDHLGRDIPREDVLRAFGSLLRIGTFKKLRRGDFVLASRDKGGDASEAAQRRHA
ncbi:hypothetical protein [Rhodovulum euryhalinum]|nr:hypothetical protein [Rhodovulum euryhalinum]